MKLSDEDKKNIYNAINEFNKVCEDGVHIPKLGGLVKRSKGLRANYSILNGKGFNKYCGNQACHAELNHSAVDDAKFIIHRIQMECRDSNWGSMTPVPTKEMDRAFIRWLTMFSPWRKCFVIKGGKKCLKLGYLVVRTDLPHNLVCSALIAARLLTEYYVQVKVWYHLVNNGVHPSVAFMFAHQVNDFGDSYVSLSINNCHHPIDGCSFTRNHLVNFVTNNPVNANGYDSRDALANAKRYTPIFNLWGGEKIGWVNGFVYKSKLREDALKICEGRRKGKQSSNPFKNLGKIEVPLEEFCKEWAPMIIKEVGELNNYRNK